MGQPGSTMVTGRSKEDLGFMFESSERFRVNNPVTVPLKGGPQGAFFLIPHPASALARGISSHLFAD
jgi:hypothetical protein